MLANIIKLLYVFGLIVVISATPAAAQTALTGIEPQPAADSDANSGYRVVAKVKPVPQPTQKVKPYADWAPSFEGLASYSPTAWFSDCCLPGAAKGQFVAGPKIFWARLDGEARRGVDVAGVQSSVVDFHDHLNFRKNGNVIWSLEAMYQFRPRWGFRYSFMPIRLEATGAPRTSFTFMGQTFTSGVDLHSKWDRFEHRAGLMFNVSRTPASTTSLFAEWHHVHDRLSIGGATATATAVSWDDSKNTLALGLEIDRCLRNYRGNTLAFTCRGSVSFLDDTVGYDAEAALGYLIPIKTGRFGFVKGGYRYQYLKKDLSTQMFGTTLDGAFLQFGFLF